MTILTNTIRSGPGTVFYCERCKLGNLEEIIPTKKQDFYDTEYRKKFGPELNKTSEYSEIFDAYVNFQEQRVAAVLPLLDKNSRLLEVGCSTGHFLYKIKNHVKEVIGVDYDSDAAAYASKRCNCITYGMDLLVTPLEEESFDIICAIQTLEHVEDPLSFIFMLKRYLKRDGWLYIEVPNLLDPLLSLYNNKEYHDFFFHEAHAYYFSPESLMTLMKKASLQGKIHYMQDYNIMNHIHWQLTHRPQPDCYAGLGVARLPSLVTSDHRIKKELDEFMANADQQYKSILASHGYTDNMAFIGKKGN
ncbi:MAG: class I SAM-dependent methyltransferase [Methanoregula sp.]